MHSSVEHRLKVPASPQRVFPLLCPVREHEWVPGWRAEVLHSDSGLAELGCVFVTPDGHDQTPVTWVIHRYEPCARIGFTIFAPSAFVELLEIELRGDSHETELVWRRHATALGAAGAELVRDRATRSEAKHRTIERALADHLTKASRDGRID